MIERRYAVLSQRDVDFVQSILYRPCCILWMVMLLDGKRAFDFVFEDPL